MEERGRGGNTKKKKERRTPATRREKKNPGGKEMENGRADRRRRRARNGRGQYGLAYYLRATSLSHRGGKGPRTESAKL